MHDQVSGYPEYCLLEAMDGRPIITTIISIAMTNIRQPNYTPGKRKPAACVFPQIERLDSSIPELGLGVLMAYFFLRTRKSNGLQA